MLTRSEARRILARWAINPDAPEDFHAISSQQVDWILATAREHRYRKPRNANGSTARYFYAYVVRRAKDRAYSGFV